MNKQQGFGFIELLLALLISSLIGTLFVEFYLNTKKSYLKVEHELDLGFDKQWLADILSDSIRRAGFTPCLPINRLDALDRRINKTISAGLIVENTLRQHILVLRMNEQFTDLLGLRDRQSLLISNELALKVNRPLIIADCEHAEVHHIQSITHLKNQNLIQLEKPLHFQFSDHAFVGQWLEEEWFIRRSKRGRNTLYYRLGKIEELSEQVHGLRTQVAVVAGKQKVDIALEWDNQQRQEITVIVRGA